MTVKQKNKNTKINNELLQEKLSSLEEKLARSLADYSNLERRIESQRQLFVTLATTSILSKMIDVLDNFSLAQKHLNDDGLQIAIDKFNSALKAEGLEEINPVNLEFDPQSMECIEAVDGQENFVIEVKKPGYKLNGHIIRPAQVSVGKNAQNIIN